MIMFSNTLPGQEIRRVELYNQSDGEPVVAAEVFQNEIRLALTDENGGFSIRCINEQLNLTLQYFGTRIDFSILPSARCNGKTKIGIDLSLSLQEVTVLSGQNTKGTSSATYNIPALTKAPVLLGQPDILRGLALRSGISHGQEGNANIFVRGGTPDQNLILLDDAPVYNVNHLGGFISIFNDDAINSVSIYKTTPPLVYGGRLSSVIDVRLRNGSNQSWRGKLGVGIVSANALLEGPLIKDKTTLMAGVRTGYFDLINIGVNKSEEGNFIDLRMSDYLIKISHQFSERHRLFLSSYRSNDVNGIAENTSNIFVNGLTVDRQFTNINAEYGNQTYSIRDYYEFSGRLQLVSFVYHTKYRNGFSEIRKTYDPDLIDEEREAVRSNLTESGAVTQFRLTSARSDYRFGLTFASKTSDPLNASLNGIAVQSNSLATQSTNLTAFGGYDYRFSQRLSFSGGLRLSFYQNKEYQELFPELRARLDYQLNLNTGFSFSANRTGQDLHLISSGTLGQNTDAYVLASNDLPIQKGWQTDIGYNQRLGAIGLLNIGYYYRRMNNVIFYKNEDQGVRSTTTILREIRTQGEGFSHGMELEAELKWKSLEVLLSYTLSRTKQRFVDINNGSFFPFRYDRPHDISLNLNYALGKKYSVGTNFIFQSGIAVTTPTARVPSSDNYISYNVVPSINNARFPAYNRMDVSITRDWKGKNLNRNTLRLSVYNVYNRINPSFYRSRAIADFAGSGEDVITVRTFRVGQFGFFPSLYYSREFGWND